MSSLCHSPQPRPQQSPTTAQSPSSFIPFQTPTVIHHILDPQFAPRTLLVTHQSLVTHRIKAFCCHPLQPPGQEGNINGDPHIHCTAAKGTAPRSAYGEPPCLGGAGGRDGLLGQALHHLGQLPSTTSTETGQGWEPGSADSKPPLLPAFGEFLPAHGLGDAEGGLEGVHKPRSPRPHQPGECRVPAAEQNRGTGGAPSVPGRDPRTPRAGITARPGGSTERTGRIHRTSWGGGSELPEGLRLPISCRCSP